MHKLNRTARKMGKIMEVLRKQRLAIKSHPSPESLFNHIVTKKTASEQLTGQEEHRKGHMPKASIALVC